MQTYFLRQTEALDIDMATRQRIWNEDKVAIHFPHIRGRIESTDTTSLNLADYRDDEHGAGLRSMRTLTELGEKGGYVWAECYPFKECLLGYVEPGTPIELFRGAWGDIWGMRGREAILKAVPLTKVKRVLAGDHTDLYKTRPRRGTLLRWHACGDRVARLVEGR